MKVFSPDLRYKQLNGAIIGKEQLFLDVTDQLRSIDSADTSCVRESLEVDGNRAIELLRQTASVTVRSFLLFRRVWKISRFGRYTWTHSQDGWRITGVEILEETVAA